MMPKLPFLSSKKPPKGQFSWLGGAEPNSIVPEVRFRVYKSKWAEEFEVDGIGPCPENIRNFRCALCGGDYPLHNHGRSAVDEHIKTLCHKNSKGRVCNELREVGQPHIAYFIIPILLASGDANSAECTCGRWWADDGRADEPHGCRDAGHRSK
jgi:hypothetical protein